MRMGLKKELEGVDAVVADLKLGDIPSSVSCIVI
jgi:orotidine-5'-phosphate decarboxylase